MNHAIILDERFDQPRLLLLERFLNTDASFDQPAGSQASFERWSVQSSPTESYLPNAYG